MIGGHKVQTRTNDHPHLHHPDQLSSPGVGGIQNRTVVYAIGEVGKAADAATLPAVSWIDCFLSRDRGNYFLTRSIATAQNYASMTQLFLPLPKDL